MNPEQPDNLNFPQQPNKVVGQPQAHQYPMPISNGGSPIPQQPLQPSSQQSPKGKKTLLIVVGAAGTTLLLLIVAVVALSSGKKTPVPKDDSNSTNATQAQVLEPATPLNVEYINDSIGQDIGSLNDEQDLPPTKLDDKALGL